MSHILGIMGGMGPLASAEFLKTIYECNVHDVEQTAPVCLLHSDPTVPDRTEAILSGNGQPVVDALTRGLRSLRTQNATRLLIACISSHHFVECLPEELRGMLISLVDVALAEVVELDGSCLLLATTGAARARIFQRSKHWHTVADQIVFPDDNDQRRIHRVIYQHLKRNRPQFDERFIVELADRYRVDAFLAGCTEFHLLGKSLSLETRMRFRFVDPLDLVARNLHRWLDQDQGEDPRFQRIASLNNPHVSSSASPRS